MDESMLCTSTTSGRREGILTFDGISKLLSGFPEPPTIIGMDYKVFFVKESQHLPNNTVVISMDLADKLLELKICRKG